MSKKRTHRQSRRKHHESAQATKRREREAAVRELAAHVTTALRGLEEAAGDGQVDPVDFADRVFDVAGDEVCSRVLAAPNLADDLASLIVERAGTERSRALAAAVAGRIPDRPLLTWLAVSVADAASDSQDTTQVEMILESGMNHLTGDDADDATCMLARARFDAGGLFEALALIEPLCSRVPDHDDAQAMRARCLGRAALMCALGRDEVDEMVSRVATAIELAKPSPAELDAAAGALDRFADRSLLHELQAAVDAFIEADPELSTWRTDFVAEFLDEARQVAGLGPLDELGGDGELSLEDRTGEADDSPNGLAAFEAMAAERAWLSGPEGDSDNLTDEESVLGRFAAAPTTPAHLARAASSWLENVRFGLWQLDLLPAGEPDPIDSGCEFVVDLVTRRRLIASIPAGQMVGLPRWTVLAGAMAPVDGVWRPGATMLVLRPEQADRIADLLLLMADGVISAAAREQGIKVPHSQPRRLPRQPRPHGVLVDVTEEMWPAESDLTSKAVGAALTYLVGMVEADKRRLPRLTNIDGDPLELVSARFPADDPAAVRDRLVRLADFESDSTDRELGEGAARGSESASDEVAPSVRWLGRPMTAAESADSLKQIELEATRRGWGPVSPDKGPRHWVRGFIHFHAGEITVDVNSRRRLDEITEVLRQAGAGKPVVGPAVDPAVDLALPRGHLSSGHMSDPESEASWRANWIDETMPALEGKTPRAAAESRQGRILLESLLRQFEHDADEAVSKGLRPLDVDALRALLGMTHPLLDGE